MAAALDQIPLFLRGGSVLATRERPRRSSPLMKHDPFTLRVALSKSGSARGELYLDDGETYDHQKGHFVWRAFVAERTGRKGLRLHSADLGSAHPAEAVDGAALAVYDPSNAFAAGIAQVRVEKVVLVGLASKPSSVKVEGGAELVWEYTHGVASNDKKEGAASILTIKDPKVLIHKDWAIVIQ